MSEESQIGTLSIEEEMKGSYLSYAMSVIIQRALPDVRDGLKPSQRRILVAMNDLNLGPRSKHRKCAKIAGDTSGNYHPHGESVIYPTLVRMAQPFNMRATLVDGQGNFGSIDADPPAAMRYTEARMTAATVEMLDDIDKQTVDFVPNYDETRSEPTVLPGKFPNLLVNGGSGIAVGMATTFAPHNLGEVCDGILAALDNPEITVSELMEYIPGPDFPTGGVICGRSGIQKAYHHGRGVMVLRAKVHTEQTKTGKEMLIVTEMPYQVSKAKLAKDIADGVKEGRLSGISDVRDESDRKGIRLIVEVKKGDSSDAVLMQLFKHTSLQTSFGVQAIALHKGRPRTFDLRGLILAYRDHRIEVIRRRSLFLLEKAERKAHILRGLLIALDNIDRIIALIRASQTTEEAKSGLMSEFSLTGLQADSILQMRLQRLTGLERQKIEEDLNKTVEEIDYHREVLSSEAKVTALIRDDVEEMRGKYSDTRRSEITDSVDDIDYEDTITDEEVVVTMSHAGYIKRVPLDTYRSQGRGGKGVTSGSTKDEDFISKVYVASLLDYLLTFSSHGKVYWLKVYQIPEMGRTAKGRNLVNLLPLEEGERIMQVIPVREFDERMVFFATRCGMVKKTALEAFSRPKKSGIIAVKIEEDDALIGVTLSTKDDDIVLATKTGMAIRFSEENARQMGRVSRGVKGISLSGDDEVVAMAVAQESATLLTICEHGYGKRTLFSEYRTQNRGGKGLIDIRTTERNGHVVTALSVSDDDDVMMMTLRGMLVRISLESVRPIGRNTQGVRLISVKSEDRVSGAEKIAGGSSDDDAAEGSDGDAAAGSSEQES